MSLPAPSPDTAPSAPHAWYTHLYVQVLVAITLGVVLGHFWPDIGKQFKPLGDAFIKLVKMIIAPVTFLTIVGGIAGVRDLAATGRVAAKAFGYFLTFSTLALIVGLVVANVLRPGAGLNVDPTTLDAAKVAGYAEKAHETTLIDFLLGIIPESFLSGIVQGNILQTLFVAVLFGIGLVLTGERGARIAALLDDVSAAVFRVVAILMKAAPVGAFGAMAFTIGTYGVGTLANLAALVATFYLTSIFFVVVVLGIVGWAYGFSGLRLLVYLRAELLLVLGTSSSESALPALISRMEAAGWGMALILGVDRFMSECRSLTNFIGNAVATIVVSRWEGVLDRQALDAALRPRGS